MIATFVILALSAAMLGYWFRYTCVLILSARTSRDYACDVATTNGLDFVQVQQQLTETSGNPDLDRLHHLLDRDYEVISALLRHAGALSLSGATLEDRMLRVDFQVMRAVYAISRSWAPAYAGRCIAEMAEIVTYFANTMGQRSVCAAEL